MGHVALLVPPKPPRRSARLHESCCSLRQRSCVAWMADVVMCARELFRYRAGIIGFERCYEPAAKSPRCRIGALNMPDLDELNEL